MSDTKDNILQVDGVSDILMEVAKLRSERDFYKEKYESLRDCTLANTGLGWGDDELRVNDGGEFNFMLKFLTPVEYEERLRKLRTQKATNELLEKEANNE